MRKTVLGVLEAQAGFQNLEVLVGREPGDVTVISCWTSTETCRVNEAADYFRDLLPELVDL